MELTEKERKLLDYILHNVADSLEYDRMISMYTSDTYITVTGEERLILEDIIKKVIR